MIVKESAKTQRQKIKTYRDRITRDGFTVQYRQGLGINKFVDNAAERDDNRQSRDEQEIFLYPFHGLTLSSKVQDRACRLKVG